MPMRRSARPSRRTDPESARTADGGSLAPGWRAGPWSSALRTDFEFSRGRRGRRRDGTFAERARPRFGGVPSSRRMPKTGRGRAAVNAFDGDDRRPRMLWREYKAGTAVLRGGGGIPRKNRDGSLDAATIRPEGADTNQPGATPQQPRSPRGTSPERAAPAGVSRPPVCRLFRARLPHISDCEAPFPKKCPAPLDPGFSSCNH